MTNQETNLTSCPTKSKHEKRLNRLSSHKKRSLGMAKWINDNGVFQAYNDRPKYIRLRNCHNILQFRDYYTVNQLRLTITNSCNLHLLCPMCAIIRAAKAVKTYHQKAETLLQENTALRLHYLVLTVLNGPDLTERFNHVEKALRKLVERRRNALKAKSGIKRHQYALDSVFANVEAGAYSFEIKRGEGSGDWHPHVNLLLLSEGEIDAEKLQAEWKEITGDSFITYCAEKPKDDKGVFVEIFKYAMKFSEMEYEDTYEAYRQLTGRRLFGTFGSFYGLKIDETPFDEVADLPYLELFYRFKYGKYRHEPKE